MPALTALYRYPVKGLSAEPLPALGLTRESGLPFDREYALALGTPAFDPDAPEPFDEGYFLMLRSNGSLAVLDAAFDPGTGRFSVTRDGCTVLAEDLSRPEGRAAVERFFEAYVGPTAKGRPRLVRADGHTFTDGSVISPAFMRAVSLVNLASVRALEERVGRPVHPLRFRANIYVEGLEPWEELGWVGQTVTIGRTRLRVLARTPRCAAIDVDPVTAACDTTLPRDPQAQLWPRGSRGLPRRARRRRGNDRRRRRGTVGGGGSGLNGPVGTASVSVWPPTGGR